MPDSYPSRAVHVLRLLGNDGRASCKCSADAPSSGRSGGAQRCVADADIVVDPSTSVAKAPHDLILAFATREIALACFRQLHPLVHEALRSSGLRVGNVSSGQLDCHEL